MAAQEPAKKRSRFGLLTAAVGLLIILPVAGATVFVLTFDPNQYRAEIATFLSDKLGRKVSLNGTMRLRLAGGPALEVNDIVLANPDWASRPEMAKIGQMALAVKLQPLLQSPRRLDVTSVVLEDADIQLETGAKGAKNWELQPAPKNAAPDNTAQDRVAAPEAAEKKAPLAISLDKVTIKNVRLAYLDGAKKQTTELKIKEIVVKAKDNVTVAGDGSFNQEAFILKLQGGALQAVMAGQAWPFEFGAQYAGNDVTAKGTLGEGAKQVDLAEFKAVTAIGSTVTGRMLVHLDGARPKLNGAVTIDAVNLAKGKSADKPAPTTAPPAGGETPKAVPADSRLFSDAKLDFSALKAVDANIAVEIGKLVTDKITLDKISTRLDLGNGNLSVPQWQVHLADNPISGELHLVTAQATPRLDFRVTGNEMNLQPVMQQLGYGVYKLGQTTLQAGGTMQGNSPRQLAGSFDGTLLLKLGSSAMPTESMGPVVNNLLKLMSPGSPLSAENKITCGAVRFKGNNGLLTSNGILLDSSLATVAGEGTVDLRSEQLKLTFKPQTKDAKLANFSAPVFVNGSLAQPQVKADAVGAVAGIAGSFLGKDLPVVGGLNKAALKVPVVNPAQPDACIAALDNPTYAPEQQAPNSVAGSALEKGKALTQEKVKGLTDKLEKAVGGDKAPPALKNLLGGEKSPLKGLFGE